MRVSAHDPDRFLAIVCYGAYAWCAACFFRRQLGGKPWAARLLGVLIFFGSMITAAVLADGRVPYIFGALVSHMLLIVLVLAVFEEEKEKKMLAGVIWETMTGLIWNFTESLLSCGGLIFIHALSGSGSMTFMGSWAGRVVLLMTYAVGTAAVSFLAKPLEPVFAHNQRSWCLSLAIPLACITLITDLANWAASNGIMVQSREKYGLYENQLFSHGAMCMFTAVAMAAAGFFVFGTERIHREEKAREQYQSQVMYYRMLEEQYCQMERLRHDMKNHMIALENLVKNRQWDHAGRYLKDMAEAGSLETGEQVTGCLVMDALLYHKRLQAEKKGITWQCDAKLPADLPIKETDLCIIAGNILDNAIEACQRLQKADTFIQVYMGQIKKCLLLEVRNSTELPSDSEIFKSRKKGPKKHGLGLASVKAAAANYNGTVHVEAENKIFSASVLLPMHCESSESPQ